MGKKRVVVVKEFEKLAGTDTEKEIVSAYVNKPLDSTILILVSLAPDFRKKPFTDLKKRAELVECKPLYDNQVPFGSPIEFDFRAGRRVQKRAG